MQTLQMRQQDETRLEGAGRKIALLVVLIGTMLTVSHFQLQNTESSVLESARTALLASTNGLVLSSSANYNNDTQNEPVPSLSQKYENASASPDDHNLEAPHNALVSTNGLESSSVNSITQDDSSRKYDNVSHVSPADHSVEQAERTNPAVPTSSQSDTSTNNNTHREKESLGHSEPHTACGWNTSETATWTPNTEEENTLFWSVMACHKRLFPSKMERWDEKYRPPPSSLRCGDNIMDEFQSILSYYDKIVIFGDSIQRQLFFTLSCMANSSLTIRDIEPPEKPKGLFRWTHEPTNTLIIFRESPKEIHKYGVFKNISSVDSSPRTAAIANLGAHYHPNTLKSLRSNAKLVAEAAETTSTKMFWMESVDFQWPSTNGEFVHDCHDCRCEALTPGRILGTGEFTGPERYKNSTKYPKHNTSITNPSGPCIPYCLPANWRNHVTNRVFEEPKCSAIHLVPIWQQLVSSGYAQSRFSYGDCTHKSTDALIAMVQQLLRALRREMKS